MSKRVLADGSLMEETRFNKLHGVIIGLFYAHTDVCYELVKFAFEQMEEKDFSPEERKILKRFGIYESRPGATIMEDGYTWTMMHDVIPYDTCELVRTIVRWKESPLHKINVVLPEIFPESVLDEVA